MVNFETIGRVAGSGDSEQLNSYSFDNENPLEGINYYCLKQKYFEGGEGLSKIIHALWRREGDFVSIYPNPFKKGEMLQIQKSDGFRLETIVNIKSQTFENTLESLTEGFYYLHFTKDSGQRIVKKLIVN